MSNPLFGALQASPQLHPAVLRAMFTTARDAGDNAQLRTLAERNDLPADVVTALAAVKNATVQAVVRARHTLPGQEAPRGKADRRPSVLAAALTSSNVDADTVLAALATYKRTRSTTLLAALLSSPASWFTAEQAVLVVRGATVYHRVPDELLARLGPQHAQEVLPYVPNRVFRALIRHDIAVDALADALRGQAQALTRDVHHVQAYRVGELAEAVLEVMSLRTDDAQMLRDAVLEGLATAHRRGFEEHLVRQSKQSRRQSSGMLAWDLTPAAPPAPQAAVTQASPAALYAAAGSPDADILAAVVAQADLTPEGYPYALITALLRNPALRAEDRHTVLAALAANPPAEHNLGHLANLDVLQLHKGDRPTIDTWIAVFPAAVLRRYGWSPYGGPQNAGRLLRDWIAREQARGGNLKALLHAALDAGLSDEQLLDLPLAVLLTALEPQTTPDLSGRVDIDRVSHLVGEMLGDHRERWTFLAAAAPSWNGTLGELLATAVQVAA